MSKVYISKKANKGTLDFLLNQGHNLILLDESPLVGKEINCHPDIFMCKLGAKPDSPIFHGNKSLIGNEYPRDSIYNGAATGRFFLHKLSITDSLLYDRILNLGMTAINVPQGYSKCNIAIVDENSIITSDYGIVKACRDYPINVLQIKPGSISLPGFSTGFIGGACGLISGSLVFNGDLRLHPDFEAIEAFITDRGVKCVFFKNEPLTDIGSIIEET